MTGPFVRRITSAVACGLAACLTMTVMEAQRAPRQVDVVVVDRDNRPVTNLTVRDFVVREEGMAREVANASPAPRPSPIVLLVDNSQAAESAISYLRDGLTRFVAAVTAGDAPPRLGYWTFGERPTKVVNEGTAALVQGEIDRLFHRPASGAHLLEAINEVCTELVKAGAERPALVAFVAESGPEFSQENRARIGQILRRAGATLWVVVLNAPAAGLIETDENRERAAVIGDATAESGGLNLTVLSPLGIPGAFVQLASLLTSRVRLAYARPETLIPPEKLEVTTRREDLKVLAPRWADR